MLSREQSVLATWPAGQAQSGLVMGNGAYLAARYGLGVLVSVANMLVMTWWIGPHDYGVFVSAIGLAAFLASLARVGVDTYLVRREAAPHSQSYGVATGIILAASLLLTLVGALLLRPLVRWYGNADFGAPYLVLLLTAPITGLTGIPTARLEREMKFRALAKIELAGQVIGLAVAATGALLGMKIWAPVAGQVAWQAFILVAGYFCARMAPRVSFNLREAKEMLSFGLGVTASLRVWQLRSLVNPLLVGRFAGAEAVAFVALAIRIAEALGTFRLAAGRLAIAALSRLQQHRHEFRAALERALFLQVISLGPLLCLFAFAGPLVFRYVVGLRWMPSLAVFPFVAAGVLVNSIYNLQASALFVLGRQWLVMRAYVAHVALLGGSVLWLLPRFGSQAYGWAELVACLAYVIIHSGLVQAAEISYRRLAPWLVIFFVLLFAPMTDGGIKFRFALIPLDPASASRQDSSPAGAADIFPAA